MRSNEDIVELVKVVAVGFLGGGFGLERIEGSAANDSVFERFVEILLIDDAASRGVAMMY